MSQEERVSTQHSATQSPVFVSVTGQLPGGKQLLHPITIKIEDDNGEFVVSEPLYHIHGEGSSIPEAIEAFKRIFSGYLDILSEEEGNLSPYMYEQLEYLRSVVGVEQ